MRTDRPCSTISPLARRLPFAVCANATFTASAENAFAKAVGFPTCETNRSDYFLPISPTPPATFFRFRYPYAVGYFLPSDIPYAAGYFFLPISLRRRIFFPSDIPTPPGTFFLPLSLAPSGTFFLPLSLAPSGTIPLLLTHRSN